MDEVFMMTGVAIGSTHAMATSVDSFLRTGEEMDWK